MVNSERRAKVIEVATWTRCSEYAWVSLPLFISGTAGSAAAFFSQVTTPVSRCGVPELKHRLYSTALQMGKVCAVFGGSRGIGRAVAELLAQKGCRLAVIARNLDVAQTTARHLGAGHLALSCDVSNEQEVQKTFEEMQRNLGPINYLVNAAGINRDALLLRTKTEDMIAQIHTNLLGTMLTCKAAVKVMIQQQGGAIVNIGSIVGLKGNSGQSVYSATKAGLVGFSRSLAKEVAKRQIRVNVVAPGFIHTEMTAHLEEDQLKKAIPLGRFGEPHEVAQAVVFLLESPYVTGSVLVVDGGLQLMT